VLSACAASVVASHLSLTELVISCLEEVRSNIRTDEESDTLVCNRYSEGITKLLISCLHKLPWALDFDKYSVRNN